MKPMKKLMLTALSLLPCAAVSAVAHAKLLETCGEERSEFQEDEAVTARRLLMPLGATTTTVEDAKRLLQEQTGITDDESLDKEFDRQVKILIEKGIVEKNEKLLMSASPSRWG